MTAQNPAGAGQDIIAVDIETEMERSFLDYSMSVIVGRALPDVRDGLKPVHRRIMYTMEEKGYTPGKPFRKCARIVGDVMGQYHPHGDMAIYDTLVRLAQPFSMGAVLVDGQGNFGSVDGDAAAASRYTEARMAKIGEYLTADIDKDTVDFVPNYDESLMEPTVLPAGFPNLLVNGTGGIAVGMATNIAPHNLGEVLTACCAYIDNDQITEEELMEIVPAPDFPTGGVILGRGGAREAYMTGRGSVVMRAKAEIEEIRKDRMAIIVTEIPYQVNKASMIIRVAELVKEKTIEGIAEIRDESDRHGIRAVFELKRDAQPDVVLNQLYKYSSMQTSFSMNMLAINAGRPQLMNLRQIIRTFVEFREEVVRRRTVHLLGKARDRGHILVGQAIAVANLDEVIKIIKQAPTPAAAAESLMAKKWPAEDARDVIALIADHEHKLDETGSYRLSEAQTKAILELTLRRLTGLERDKIHAELRDIAVEIADLLETLGSREKLYRIIRAELAEVKDKFAIPRVSQIVAGDFDQDDEDLIPREDMAVTITGGGYIKRVPLSTYNVQNRGGKGRNAMATKEEDFVEHLLVTNTHTPLLFFSSKGKVYKLKTYRLPQGTPQSQGRALVNLLPVEQGETISTVMAIPATEAECAGQSIMFATASGNVRRNRLEDFFNVQSNGKIAMKLDQGDSLIGVQVCNENQDIILAARNGKCVRFPVTEIRVFASRSSDGIRGMRLAPKDEIVSMSVVNHVNYDIDMREAYLKRRRDETADTGLTEAEYEEMAAKDQILLTVSSEGVGKRSSAYEYRITARGGSGVTNMDLPKGAAVLATFPVTENDEIMLVTDGGKLIRLSVSQIRLAGRATKGVILFRTGGGEKVVSVSRIEEGSGGDDNDCGDGDIEAGA